MQERPPVWADRHGPPADPGLGLSGRIPVALLNKGFPYQGCLWSLSIGLYVSMWSLLPSQLQEQNLKSHPVCLPGTSAGQQSPVWLCESAWFIGFYNLASPATLSRNVDWNPQKAPRLSEEIKRKPSVAYLAGCNFFLGTKSERKDWFL